MEETYLESLSLNRFEEITSKFKDINNILILGDVGVDHYIYGTVDRISPEAPVPVLRVTKEEQKLGMAANIGHNIFALGGKSSLVGIIGNDKRGESLRKLLEKEGVSLEGLLKLDDVQTISKERILTARQQICRVDYEMEKPQFSPENLELLKSAFTQQLDHCDYVVFEDYSKGVFTEKTTQEYIKAAISAKKFVAVDPGRGKPAELYKGATLLKPNLFEARELVHSLGYSEVGISDMVKILVDKLKLQSIALTLGPEGMALYDREAGSEVTVLPTLANEVFDVSGAGDTVIAVMTMGLSAGATLVEAGWLSNIAAGVVVSKSGTATVNLNELTEYYNYVSSKK